MTNYDEDEKEKLTPAQIQAIGLLALGESITSAAESLSLARQTVSGWLNGNPDFQTALRACQAEIFDDEKRRVRGMAARALDVIFEALENPNLRIRLTAANKLVSALNLRELLADKPAVIPPAVVSEFCGDCGKRHEERFFKELAEMNF